MDKNCKCEFTQWPGNKIAGLKTSVKSLFGFYFRLLGIGVDAEDFFDTG